MTTWMARAAPFVLVLLMGSLPAIAQAQDHHETANEKGPRGKPAVAQAAPGLPANHRFWDKENDWLFAGVGVMRGLDFASTLNFRARGRQEILLTNSVVDNKPLFAAIEVAGTGASIGASYLFHRSGHHKLERWVSVVHIGVTGFGVVRNYSLKSAEPHVRSADASP